MEPDLFDEIDQQCSQGDAEESNRTVETRKTEGPSLFFSLIKKRHENGWLFPSEADRQRPAGGASERAPVNPAVILTEEKLKDFKPGQHVSAHGSALTSGSAAETGRSQAPVKLPRPVPEPRPYQRFSFLLW